jgi:hypothetical protein
MKEVCWAYPPCTLSMSACRGSKGPNVWAGKVAGVMGAGGGAGTGRSVSADP